jgi:hypothetical protein
MLFNLLFVSDFRPLKHKLWEQNILFTTITKTEKIYRKKNKKITQ